MTFKINETTGYEIIDAYYLVDNFDSVVEEIKQETYSKYPEGTAGPMGGRIMDGWRECEAIKKLATAPHILEYLSDTYGYKALPFQTLNFMKGTEQRTHSDTIHFNPVTAGYMCGVWIALEDINEFNGPLHYYIGSHQEPVYQMHDLGIKVIADDVGRFEGTYGDFDRSYRMYEDFVEKTIPMKYPRTEFWTQKGGGLVWDCNLFHGGSPVKDKTLTRWSQVTHYFFDCDSKFTQPRLSHIPSGNVFTRNIEVIQ